VAGPILRLFTGQQTATDSSCNYSRCRATSLITATNAQTTTPRTQGCNPGRESLEGARHSQRPWTVGTQMSPPQGP